MTGNKTIYIAQSIATQQVQPLHLEATEPFPDITISGEAGFAAARGLHADQGKTIVDALYASLPGGTIDAILCEMLQRRASLLRVPFDTPKQEDVSEKPFRAIHDLFTGIAEKQFKEQRQLVKRIIDDGFTVTPDEQELLEGLQAFLNGVASIAYDQFGKDCLLPAKSRNFYECNCDRTVSWELESDGQCSDNCPKCGKETEPYKTEEIRAKE